MQIPDQEISKLLKVLLFASEKHSFQRRKNEDASPYINHPIKVAEMLWSTGEVRDLDVISGALLHDTLEDTSTSYEELSDKFGKIIADYVLEVSDDKKLSKQERKQQQIEKAPYISKEAKQIKIADKISNISDLVSDPPVNWPLSRKIAYLDWANEVMKGLKGTNEKLEKMYYQVEKRVREMLLKE